jgi:hypothetical protein
MTPEHKERTGVSQSSNAAAKQGEDSGVVICPYCEQELTLIHRSNGTHQATPPAIHLKDQQALPGLFP